MFPWYGNVTNSSCIENYSTICIDQRMSFKKMQFWHKNNCCILESIIFIGDTNFHMQALFASTLTFVIKIHTITHRTRLYKQSQQTPPLMHCTYKSQSVSHPLLQLQNESSHHTTFPKKNKRIFSMFLRKFSLSFASSSPSSSSAFLTSFCNSSRDFLVS